MFAETIKTATDQTSLFEHLDLFVAKMAAKFLPEDWSPSQRDFVTLLFACCHLQSRKGHYLLNTKQLPEILKDCEVDVPETDSLEAIFQSLPTDFNDNPKNPIYWKTPQVLYIRKFWKIETDTAAQITRYSKVDNTPAVVDFNKVEFPPTMTDEQMDAARAPLMNPLVLISGGPGTGKTFTVFQSIRAMLQHFPDSNIRLLAPTGKAVARIQESIRNALALEGEISSTLLSQTNLVTSTIHRFLNQQERRKTFQPPYPQPQTPIDFVIVDEASMVDLSLLNRLLRVLDPQTRLVLMGDIHQLSSVQPGAAFADIFEVSSQPAINIPSIELNQHFRFKDNPELGFLCEGIREGNEKGVLEQFARNDANLQLVDSASTESINEVVKDWIKKHILPHICESDPEKALSGYADSMILCAQNEGPIGVNTLNRVITQSCDHHFHNPTASCNITQPFYWKPVLVRRNDYALKLFNGDLGVLQHTPMIGGQFRGNAPTSHNACFKTVEENLTTVPQHLLPEHQDGFAFTIHKSQGSEANHVLVLLPDEITPLLSRELLYTAASRAKRGLTIVATTAVLSHCIQTPTHRQSFLTQRILNRVK